MFGVIKQGVVMHCVNMLIAEYSYVVSHYVECHYPQCHYDECRFADCRGAILPTHSALLISVLSLKFHGATTFS